MEKHYLFSLFKTLKNSSYAKSLKWGFFSVIINFAKQILLIPILLMSVGKDGFAFWIIIQTISLMVRAVNLGQLNYTSNVINLNYHINKGDVEADLIKGQSASLMLIMVQIILAFVISFPFSIELYTQYEYQEIVEMKAQHSIILLVVATIIYQYISLFLLRLLEPIGKINLTIKYQGIGELITFIITGVVIFFTESIFYTCLSIFIVTIIYSGYLYLHIKKELPFKVFLFKNFSLLEGVKVVKKSLVLSLSFVVEKIYEIGLNLFVAKLYSGSTLALFSTNRVMSNASVKISNIITIPLLPNMQKQFALEDKQSIVLKMGKFWKTTSQLIILGIILVLPFIEKLYYFWTRGELDYNKELVIYMFVAIVFQNFSTIVVEFIKKTNLSNEILIYNLTKVSVTIILFFYFSLKSDIAGLGFSLFIGEIISLVLICFFLQKGTMKNNFIIVFFRSIAPLLLFSISMFVYLEIENYYYLLAFNLIVLLLFNYKNLKNVFNNQNN